MVAIRDYVYAFRSHRESLPRQEQDRPDSPIQIASQLLSTLTLDARQHWKCAVSVVVSDRYCPREDALLARAANTIATLKEHSG